MFQNNKLNLILSIVAAIVIWAYVITEVNPMDDSVIDSVPVELINLDSLAEDRLTVSPAQTYTVSVVVHGSRTNLSGLQSNDLKATANLKGFSKGLNSVDVVVAKSDKFTVTEVRPKRIDILVEDLVSATKPIRLAYEGKFPQNTEAGFVTVAPQEIEVASTKAQVDDVAFIEAKVNVSDLSEKETTLTAEAIPIKSNGEAAYGLTLSQNVIDVTATLCTVREVPLELSLTGEPPEGIEVTKMDVPKTVFVRGKAEDVAGIESIAANGIDISSLRETAIIKPVFNLPPHVELADRSRDLAVAIEVEGIVAKNLSYTADQVEILGPVSGYAAHVNAEDITVTVFGNRAQTDAFKAADLRLYIELSEADCAEGSVYAEVKFKYDKPLKRLESNPLRLHVVIEAIASGGGIGGGGGTGGILEPGTAGAIIAGP
ncbi:MAG: hypothetical protein LBO81_04760 [Clostridiales Family XIII bacterium]|jgi:YbbR domain-containing protein|nr:hypothetical protein [Clostridiales Family XIII bacterium]